MPSSPQPTYPPGLSVEVDAVGPVISYPRGHPASPALHLTRVHPDRIGDVVAVLDDAARWLTERGIEQWPGQFSDNGGHRITKLVAEARAGNVWLVSLGARPVATATITDWADPDFAAAWPGGPGGALYVCRLATTQTGRDIAKDGPGLGARLLDFADHLARGRRVGRLRLDCSRTNSRLHSYYLRQGFKPMGVVEVAGRRSGALFERPVTQERTGELADPHVAGRR